MALHELSLHFKNGIDWSLRGRAFLQQFGPEARRMRGLYAHIDTNTSSPHPIYDSNRPPKIIVLQGTAALKVGKFENGLPERMLTNYDHFHRRPPGGAQERGIFPDVLSCLYVLDLAHRSVADVRSSEKVWNRSIRVELARRSLIHEAWKKKRGESINLARELTSEELLVILTPIAEHLDR